MKDLNVFDPGQDRENNYPHDPAVVAEREKYIASHFDEALEKSWIEVWLQPVVRSLTGNVCSFEALSRWRDPVYGMITPAEFVPVLEKNGLSFKLAAFVADDVARIIVDFEKREHRKAVPISFNLSRMDFESADPFEMVEKTVAEYGIERWQISIEVTESTAVSNPELIGRKIDQFHEAGYMVLMDDFGSAYSSLNVLKNFAFDEIKLDMTFLKNMNDKSRVIIRSCVDMVKDIGLRTLCEGAETAEQVDFLRDIGCELIQGFYYSRPLPVSEIRKKLANSDIRFENEGMETLFSAISHHHFTQDVSWCFSVYEDGQIWVIYESKRFRRNVVDGHLFGV